MPNKTLLIMEPDDHQRLLLNWLFTGDARFRNLNVQLTDSATKALAYLRANTEEVIGLVTSISCGGTISGLDMLKALAGTVDVSIVVVTTQTSLMEECLDLGVSDFIDKPYHNQDLLDRVAAAIEITETT